MLKPLLAATYEKGMRLDFPIFGSPKLDGIRCLIQGGVALSRNLKPIRNEYIQSIIGKPKYNGYDGELIVGSPVGALVYNRTNSGVMSVDGEPDFTYHVFDRFDLASEQYVRRLGAIEVPAPDSRIQVVAQSELKDQLDVNAYEIMELDAGYEGIMLRSPWARYKMGRSTVNEGILYKVKRFEDYECLVVGIQERQSNQNPQLVDHLGHAIRSKHQENMVAAGMIGALICVKINELGQPISDPMRVAPGTMTHAQAKTWWMQPDLIVNRVVKVKSFAYGEVDQPRFARYHGHRDPLDA